MGYLSYQHRDLNRRQRGAVILKGVATDIGYQVEKYPKTALLLAAAAVYGTVSAVSSLYQHAVHSEALPQIQNQKSHLAETRTLGVQRAGTIFYGVAQLKNDDKNKDIALLNSALSNYAPSSDSAVGCRVAVLNVKPEESGIMSALFNKPVVVTSFNNAAFTDEKYTCAGKTLTPAVPRPLKPFIQPSSVTTGPNHGMV